ELFWLNGSLNPLHTAETVHWIPKLRYQLMRQILPRHGRLGLEMMTLTTSTQISLDYADEADAGDKLRAAAAMVPLVTALYANSPIYAARKSGYISYRSQIWSDTDPSRCGVFPFMFNAGANCFDAYVDYALQVPMFFTLGERPGEPKL